MPNTQIPSGNDQGVYFLHLLGFAFAEHSEHMHTSEVRRSLLHNQHILITLKNKPPKTSKPPLFL